MDAEIRKQDKSHFSAAGFTPTAALSLFSLVKKKKKEKKKEKKKIFWQKNVRTRTYTFADSRLVI